MIDKLEINKCMKSVTCTLLILPAVLTWIFVSGPALASNSGPAHPPIKKSAPKKIMLLGDSITQGSAKTGNYRQPLYRLLQHGGYSIDFVGSLNTEYGVTLPSTAYDPDHEGHWAWRADEVLTRINGWAQTAKPDIILLHLGTNDVGSGQSIKGTVQELRDIIDVIRNANPCVVVLVAKIIPLKHFLAGKRIPIFNKALESLLELNTKDSPIVLVDQFTGMDPDKDLYDGVHPNNAGAQKMAQKWYLALQPHLGSPHQNSAQDAH